MTQTQDHSVLVISMDYVSNTNYKRHKILQDRSELRACHQNGRYVMAVYVTLNKSHLN